MSDIYEKLEELKSKPLKVMFIRLGSKGDRFKECEGNSTMYFGFGTDQMLEQCNAINLNEKFIEKKLENKYKKINDTMRQIKSFFEDKGDTLWITTANRTIYFGFSNGEQAFLKEINGNQETYKSMQFGWTNKDKSRKELNISGLNGGITKTLAYQSTICKFDEKYAKLLVNRILNIPSEVKEETAKKHKALVDATETLIKQFQPKDLELLVELIISRSGLKRIGAAGKSEEFIDSGFEHPMTGDVYIVQVKSKTIKKEFKDYIDAYDNYFANNQKCKFIYAFHTAELAKFQSEIDSWKSKSSEEENRLKEIILWDSRKLARLSVDNGLADWVINIAPV